MVEIIIGFVCGCCFGYMIFGLVSEDKSYGDFEEDICEAYNRGYHEGRKVGYKKGYKDCMEDERRGGHSDE